MPPKQINQKRLVKIFKDVNRLKSEEIRFCFLLGAGASRSSGIPTGWELATQWYSDLQEDLDESELKKWEKEIRFDYERIGEFYPKLYEKRYESFPQVGYEEFKVLMENKEPSIGYVILSKILVEEKHNFVLTTNFDYLIEDAVRMYTSTKPFAAGHETLASFISSQTERPTIIKVHRDLFLHPFNDEEKTKALKIEWKEALRPILKNFNLLVIGYGGNDGSLMDYFSEINSEERKPIYWCKRKDDALSDKIIKLLNDNDYVVTINDFDELMYALHNALEYKIFEHQDESDDHQFVKDAKKRIKNLNTKLKELLDRLKQKELGEDEANNVKSMFKGALIYLYRANFENNINKKEKIYLEGITKYPENIILLSDYAWFLSDIKKDHDEAEKYYTKVIRLDSNHVDNLGNYANFLFEVRKDYDKAEELYKKALSLSPNHSQILANYGSFLKTTKNNFDGAEEFYKKAILLNPNQPTFLANYANFLFEVRKDYDKAEEFYKKAILLNPNQPTFLANYASFLFEIRKDYSKAEELYKKAIELDSENSNNLGNYAFFLQTIQKDYDKAEEFYKKAIKLKPTHTNHISNYANFLFVVRKNYDATENLYKKVIELDPNHADNLGSYANFLFEVRKDYDKAEELYKKAIELAPENANILGNYANFLIISKNDFQNAEKYIDNAFELKPHRLDLLSELWFYRYAHYKKYLELGSNKLEELMSLEAKSIDWNFKPHIEIATKNKHPNIKKLKMFADALTK